MMVLQLFITFLLRRVMPESARWLIGKGKIEKTVAILKKAAQVNGKSLSPEVINEFRVSSTCFCPICYFVYFMDLM